MSVTLKCLSAVKIAKVLKVQKKIIYNLQLTFITYDFLFNPKL